MEVRTAKFEASDYKGVRPEEIFYSKNLTDENYPKYIAVRFENGKTIQYELTCAVIIE